MPDALINEFSDKGFFSFNLNYTEFSEKKDCELTTLFLEQQGLESIVILDHYQLGIEWECAIKKKVRHLVVIDDFEERAHDCDILIDKNLYEKINERYQNLVPKDCKKLLGPKYAH